ncbi:hypothetical protein BU17DRAFT_69644 [Hysterangium stoloniferum]|nr:hypothetical protein BU17DRAFT_69644 [Hysterangium stoloniferum]
MESQIFTSTPSQTVWIEDGDIVLWGENTLFRVRQAQLELHSVWWNETSHLRVMASKYRMPDGCPIVTTSCTAVDLERWLAALHGIQVIPSAIDTLDDFRRAASIAYISFKYESHAFFHEAVASIQLRWPSELQSWKIFVSECETPGGGVLAAVYLAVHPARVIYIARQTRQFLLLPAAYHLLVQMTPKNAAPPYDMTFIPEWISFFGGLMGRYDNLLLYYATERREITQAFVDTIEACASTQRSGHEEYPDSCSNKVKRQYGLEDREHPTIKDMLLRRISDDSEKPPSAIFTYTEEFPAKYGLCQSCTNAVNRDRKLSFYRIWFHLPIALGLGQWESVPGVRFSA